MPNLVNPPLPLRCDEGDWPLRNLVSERHPEHRRAYLRDQAVIFDMDGVVIDSEPIYAKALNNVLRKEGVAATVDDQQAVVGSSLEFTWRYMIERFNLAGDVEKWITVYEAEVAKLLSANASASDGLHWLLESLEQSGIRIGLATGSKTKWAEIILNQLGVVDAFEAIATADMVEATKPAPDLYLLCARKIGVSPEHCLAIEDTPRGIASAKAAGMTAVALHTDSTAGMDFSAADHAIDRLTEFDFGWLAIAGTGRTDS